jgi:hypothetical protein
MNRRRRGAGTFEWFGLALLALMPAVAHGRQAASDVVERRWFEARTSHFHIEPEKQSCLLALAQLQLKKHDPEAARRTLELLRRPEVAAQVRATAEELLQELAREKR